MRKASRRERKDFREFVFTATGGETDTDSLSAVDVYDNLTAELDRIQSITVLLECSGEEAAGAVEGVALLLKDIHNRMRTVLELAIQGTKKESRRNA